MKIPFFPKMPWVLLVLINAVVDGWAAPTIQNVTVSPNPVVAGQSVTVAVTASVDVVQGIATLDFRPNANRLLRITLAKQGALWTGSTLLPGDLGLAPGAQMKVSVLVYDSARKLGQSSITVDVSVSPAILSEGILTVTGDNTDNTLIVSRTVGGEILVNNGAIPVTGGVPTVANTTQIHVFGLGGNDTLTIDDSQGPMPTSVLYGGPGDDTLNGSNGNDILDGGPGNDILNGRRGNDVILGGTGDDTIVWNPGDGSDTIEGQGGTDTLVFNGANVAEKFDISANGSRVRFSRDVGNIVMDLNGIEAINLTARGGQDHVVVGDLPGTDMKGILLDLAGTPGSGVGDGQTDTVTVNGTPGDDHILIQGSAATLTVSGLSTSVTILGSEGGTDLLQVNALGGNDVVNAASLPANIINLTIDGGPGDDVLTGSAGADLILGGPGNDTLTGGRGNDVLFGGDDDDEFIWNPGDGSDTVEGQNGIDHMIFNGSNANENFALSANGARVRLFRDVGNVTMDLNGIEEMTVNAFGGADNVVVNDLSGTQLKTVGLDLASIPGTETGDGQSDTVTVNGTAGADSISITNPGGGLLVDGLAAEVAIFGAEPANDNLIVNGLAGSDQIDASGLAAGFISLTLNGGDGDDVLVGSQGDDLVLGGRGNDVALLGAGNDTFVWNPGDGSDTVEGQSGTNRLVFNGANVSEQIDISANGTRIRFSRDVGNVTMDLNGIEEVDFSALGGADTITVNNLTGTSASKIGIDLAGVPNSGTGDGQADTVVVNGTTTADSITISNTGSIVSVTGLSARVDITGAEAANDRLIVNSLGGDDGVEASGLSSGLILLTEDGGDGDDVLIGSAGDDVLKGGSGDDVLIGGPGTDILDGGTGNNILLQD